jgi:hypothetical protein
MPFLFCSTYLLHELTSTSTNTFMSAQLWIWRSIIISNDSSFQINHTHHMYLFWEDILSIGIYLQWHLNHSFWCSALFTLLKINELYRFELDNLQWIFHCRGSVFIYFSGLMRREFWLIVYELILNFRVNSFLPCKVGELK